MPHVAHLTTVHHPQDPRIFHRQCKTLRDAGYDVHLVAQRSASAVVEGIHVHALPEVKGRAARLRLQPRMYGLARAIPASVYHIHDPELIPLLWLLKRTTGAAVIYDMHEDYAARAGVEGTVLRALERWAFRWVDHVIVVDDQLEQRLSQHKAPCTKIANYTRIGPADSQKIKSADSEGTDGPLRLIQSGYQSEKRGLFTMLELASMLGPEEASLTLAGRCNYPEARAKAEQTVAQRGMEVYTHLLGWESFLPHEQIADAYSQADVGLVMWHPDPNHTRIPTKFYEYLQYGLPIVCSDFPLWRSFVEAHGCGAVVPPGDAAAAARVLQHWRADPDAYHACAQAAQAAAPRFRWTRVAPVLESVYQQIRID